MNRCKWSLFFALYWLVMGVAWAQEPQVLRLGIDDCVAIALEQSAQVVQGRFNVESAAIQVENARNAFLPSMSTSYGMSRSLSGPREGSFVDPATGEITSTLGESTTSGSQSLGASFGMDLYRPSNWVGLASSKLARKAAKMDLSASQQQVVFEVKQGYFSLLQAIELMAVQAEQVSVSEEDLRRAETLFEIRSVPLSDVLTSRATLASARATMIDRENNVELARADLAFAMGLRTYAKIEPQKNDFSVVPLTLAYEEVLAHALEHRPDLRSQKFSMLQAREDLKGTRYELLHPTVSMSTGYSWQLRADEEFQGPEDLFLKNYGYSLSMSVSLPVFNRFSTQNSIKSQKLSYRQSMEDLQQAQRQVALDIRRAFLNIELYRRSIEANQIAVSAAEESYKLAQERYALATGTQLERLEAQSSLFATRNDLVQAQFNYHIQLAQLDQAMGRPFAVSGK